MPASSMGAAAGSVPGLTLKAWAVVDNAGTLIKGNNIASHTHPQGGNYAFTFTAAMASTNYIAIISWPGNNTSIYVGSITGKTVNGCTINTNLVSGGTLNDLNLPPFHMAFYE